MAKNPKKTKEVFKQDDVLQAVVITDSFNSRFDPVTKKLPRCLLPLANVPLLHYTISQLILSGIQEIIIFCCAHAHQIRQFVKEKDYSSDVDIQVIIGEVAQSLGDAMRDLDSQGLIKSDFVLVSGDVITNLNFGQLLRFHKERREREHNAIMTWTLKKTFNNKDKANMVIGYLPSKDAKLVQLTRPTTDHLLNIDVNALAEDIQLRYDLVDIGVCICSINIPPLFQDNFDYDTVEDLITGVITNEEILNSSIHVSVVDQFVAGQVSDMHQYEKMTTTVLTRGVSPWQPDLLTPVRTVGGLAGSSTAYVAKNAILPRSTQLKRQVLVGPSTVVGNNCTMQHCVIGSNCKIGNNVTLSNCFLWNDVIVEDGCTINQSLLCNNVIVKANSIVVDRSVLCADVVVGPRADIKSNTVLVADKGECLPESVVGSEAKAFLFSVKKFAIETDEEDNTDDNQGDITFDSSDEEADDYVPIWFSQPVTYDSEDLFHLLDQVSNLKIEDSSSKKSADDPFKQSDDNDDDSEALFLEEVCKTLERGLKESIQSENIVLEINSLKHAYNIPIDDVYFIVSKAIVEYPLTNSSLHSDTATKYFSGFSKLIGDFRGVLDVYLHSEESKKLCIQAVEEVACEQNVVLDSIIKVLHLLYDRDILSEEIILWWYSDSPLLFDSEMAVQTKKVRSKVMPFIQWLQEAEEESDDESD